MLDQIISKATAQELHMETELLQGPFPTHTCFLSQKAPPWCDQSRAFEGHQEQRSGPQLHLGSGAPGSYVEKIHKDVTSSILQPHGKMILQTDFHQVLGN